MPSNINRRTFLQNGTIIGTALLAGCTDGGKKGDRGGNGNGSSPTNPNSSNKGLPKVALSVPSLQLPFFARMQNAFEQAKKKGMISDGSTFYSAQGSQSEQISDIQTAITNNVDLLLVVPITAEGVGNAIKSADKAGIPVATIDRNVAEGKTITYVASDNVALGRRSTELCLESMTKREDESTYNILQLKGTPGATTTRQRTKGFKKAINKHKNLKILASQSAQFKTAKALQVMEDFITQYGDQIDGVFAQNDLMALGVHQALKNNNMIRPVTGIDGTEAWVKLFNKNQYYGTIAQLPEEMVYTAIRKGKAYLKGKNIKGYYRIRGLRVTQKNAQEYLDKHF